MAEKQWQCALIIPHHRAYNTITLFKSHDFVLLPMSIAYLISSRHIRPRLSQTFPDFVDHQWWWGAGWNFVILLIPQNSKLRAEKTRGCHVSSTRRCRKSTKDCVSLYQCRRLHRLGVCRLGSCRIDSR